MPWLCIFHIACAYAPYVTLPPLLSPQPAPSLCIYARSPSPPTFPQAWRHPCPPHPQFAPSPPPCLLLVCSTPVLPIGALSACLLESAPRLSQGDPLVFSDDCTASPEMQGWRTARMLLIPQCQTPAPSLLPHVTSTTCVRACAQCASP
jgi:hypothetical protein